MPAEKNNPHLLVAKLDDVKILSTMLKTIHFKDTAMVIIHKQCKNHYLFQCNYFHL